MIERVVLLAIGLGLIALALSPRLFAAIPHSILFAGLTATLLAVGVRQLVTAPRLGDEVSQKMTGASALRRVWLPARWYTRSVLLWQFRIMSVIAITMAVMIAFLALLVHRRGL